LDAITASTFLNDEIMSGITQSHARYILIEKIAPFSKALARGATGFKLLYENRQYELWKTTSP
jgi:hypothetical protein